MMASSHLVVGAAAWLFASSKLGLAFDPVALGVAAVGALAPDIDHPRSALGRLLRPVSTVVSFVFGHRGVTHSALAVLACAWLLTAYGAQNSLLLPFLVGYVSHLAGDLLTPAGLPLLWPLKRRRTFSFPVMKTGGFSEQVVATVLGSFLIAGVLGGGWPRLPDDPWAAVRTAAAPYLGEEARPPVPPRKPKVAARPAASVRG